mmetsp:Transcript_4503/g.14957  ORF Transcript_4503/g.14957 Transcript_4503/m.14957 type:complete len:306 (-) Transcript_4503:194-1111(-)
MVMAAAAVLAACLAAAPPRVPARAVALGAAPYRAPQLPRQALRWSSVPGAPEAATAPAPESMTAHALKDELRARGRGAEADACFEKGELVDAVRRAREQGFPVNDIPGDGKASAAPRPEPGAPTSSPAGAGVSAPDVASVAEELRSLRVSELRQKLADRNIGWAGLFDKDDLVARLAAAVAAERVFSATGAVRPGAVAELSETQARAELADGRSPLVVDVYAKWCGPCQLMGPQLAAAAARLGPAARVAKVDSDRAPALSTELRVQGLPTVLFLRDGEVAHRQEGAMTCDQILALCREHLGVSVG